MNRLILSVWLCAVFVSGLAQSARPFNDTTLLQPLEVTAVRAAALAPFAKTNISKKSIEQRNMGQDLPFLLNQIPGIVANSDAGNGIGYTGIRIRGTDATRINVTLNGIPYNDAESQNTFLVNLPDFASSAGSIQVQRGVGTSTNGAGSFGGTINISTNEVNSKLYAEMNNAAGSFNSRKHTFKFGSGLLGKHFLLEGRLSQITSDGYIDRASSDLRAAYGSIAWVDASTSLRLNVFTGKEKTYQAWYGVPENLLTTNRTYNGAGIEQPGKPFDNETDNYNQTHYQLFFNQRLNSSWKWNMAVFLTNGKGYYEQYKTGQALNSYGLPDFYSNGTTITQTDLIRQLWLDNDFYGSNFSAHYKRNSSAVIIGGGWNRYDGQHFGQVKWASVNGSIPTGHRWYETNAVKTDVSGFVKYTEQFGPRWQSFIDVQWRSIRYNLNGFRNNPELVSSNSFGFFNPKLGVTYINQGWQAYASYARAGHEPNRDDFEAGGSDKPGAEFLNDFELGAEKQGKHWSLGANLYYMLYKNQLVLTGKINDVGAYTRINIPRSYRAGVEIQGKMNFSKWLNLNGNINFSRNRIKDFTEYIDDYDNGGQLQKSYAATTISFSPDITATANVELKPVKSGSINFISKYVSRQYLDNTTNRSRSLNPFFVQDILLNYTLHNKIFKTTTLLLQLNNVLNRKYEPNGYTFSYQSGGQLTTENFYFPMAGFNWMAGINIAL